MALRTVIAQRSDHADSSLLWLCTLLVIGKRLAATLDMLAQRLAVTGAVSALPSLERGTVLLSLHPEQFSKLGWLLLRRSFHGYKFDVQLTSYGRVHWGDILEKDGLRVCCD